MGFLKRLFSNDEVREVVPADLMGQLGTVSSRIPAGGLGEVRIWVRGSNESFSARADEELPEGTKVVVTDHSSPTVVQVTKF